MLRPCLPLLIKKRVKKAWLGPLCVFLPCTGISWVPPRRVCSRSEAPSCSYAAWCRQQIHKTAQLGLKPAPNGRDFGWAAFGAAPVADAPLPPSQASARLPRCAGASQPGKHAVHLLGVLGRHPKQVQRCFRQAVLTCAWPQSTHKYQELQRKMDAARGAPGAAGDSQRPCRAADGGEEEGGGHGPVAKTSGSQSPRAAAAAAAAAALAGLPRAVALQQQQQDPRRRLRAVQKKLRQIAVLEERQRERWAAQLLPEEAAKLAQREQLEAEAAALQAEVG